MTEQQPQFTPAYFECWDHATLANLASELFHENHQLKRDLKAALEAFRKEVSK